jgi:hypothetical protein
MIYLNYNWFFTKFLPYFFVCSVVIDLEINFLLLNLVFLHLIKGLHSIFLDYIHEKNLSFYLSILLKVLFIENLSQLIKFFF